LTDYLGDGDWGGQTRVAVHGQSSIKALALDAGSLGEVGNSLVLREMAQRDQQDVGLVFIFSGDRTCLGARRLNLAVCNAHRI
jgi:hypothetical protein